ncbi:hypothetical protein [Carboxylicivirga taeanensis]|uniref:hypothetical protein n=1 Tax=Carboxylicivirga taeanensis TaxID=1416875 RepID=UPI003F6DFAA7
MYLFTKAIRLVVVMLMLIPHLNGVNAQSHSEQSAMSVGMDLTSRFYWRGMSLSSSPSIQPYLELSKGAFTIGTWGSYSFAEEPYQEIDVYLSFQHENLRLSVSDNFNVVDSSAVSQQYFNWNQTTSAHAVEVLVEWFDIFKSQLSVEAAVFVYGADLDDNNAAFYSTYIEPQYNFSMGENQVCLFSGFTPARGMYASQAAFVNVGIGVSRELAVNNNVSFPLSVIFALNPHSKGAFMVATLSL